MKVLIICSHREYAPYTNNVAPFIYEQMQGLTKLGCEFRICFVQGGGLKSYIQAWRRMCKYIEEYEPNIIHAHYGLCCMIANLQRKVPVISTYHGSDINNAKIRWISKIAIRGSKMNVFVSEKLRSSAGNPSISLVIPCGVDVKEFYPMDKINCREQMGLEKDKIYILFSKAFTVPVKNYPLAKAAVELLIKRGMNVELLELKGYTRSQVVQLMNACDCALMTSFNEGSPQFVKEALACNCPIVSTDVGDVKEQISGLKNCYITSFEPLDVAEKIKNCINNYTDIPLGRKRVLERYNNQEIINKIFEIYNKLCKD